MNENGNNAVIDFEEKRQFKNYRSEKYPDKKEKMKLDSFYNEINSRHNILNEKLNFYKIYDLYLEQFKKINNKVVYNNSEFNKINNEYSACTREDEGDMDNDELKKNIYDTEKRVCEAEHRMIETEKRIYQNNKDSEERINRSLNEIKELLKESRHDNKEDFKEIKDDMKNLQNKLENKIDSTSKWAIGLCISTFLATIIGIATMVFTLY